MENEVTRYLIERFGHATPEEKQTLGLLLHYESDDDYVEQIWKAAVRHGDAQAQYLIGGVLLNRGHGNLAVMWLKRAAAAGNLGARDLLESGGLR